MQLVWQLHFFHFIFCLGRKKRLSQRIIQYKYA